MTTQPTRSAGHPSPGIAAIRIGIAVTAIALCAQVSVPIPGTPVPQSLQTLAVAVVGLTLGPTHGALAVTLYVVLGGAGAPIFADGAGGMESLRGPTAGYLVGFIFGAAVAGLPTVVDRIRNVLGAFAAAVAAHVVILGFGWLRLASMLGATAAYTAGVAPFLVGGVVKAVAASLLWIGFERLRRELSPPAPSDPQEV
jgi:biotin transport system substrate-specific component